MTSDSDFESLPAIARLPPELIGEIFSLTLPHTRRIGYRQIPSGPWRLGHICSRWRTVAVGYTALWSDITLFTAANLHLVDICSREMLEEHLRRSGLAPLHVWFQWSDSESVDLQDLTTSALVSLVIGESRRWETLSIVLDDFTAEPLFERLARIHGRIPLLRSLEMIFLSGRSYDFLPGGSNAFAIAPRLDELRLTNNAFAESSWAPTVGFPSTQIKSFRACYSFQDDALYTLQSLPHLEDLAICIRLSQVRETRSLQTIVKLHRLHRLHLRTTGHLLDCVFAPALRELRVTLGGINGVAEFLRRCGSQSLVQLVVDHCPNPKTLIEILGLCPALQEVKVKVTFGMSFFFAWAATDEGPLPPDTLIQALVLESLCPLLERLDITVDGKTLDPRLVLDMLETRVGLRYVHIVASAGADESMELELDALAKRVESLRTNGMVLDLVLTPVKPTAGVKP
ncbi:hypothetical protein C8F01DRAFT_1157840 [Mycena amicta]|nr:hypothetical protein C8F01DRAFT_1157840 [Mycena amicta]